MTKTTKPMKDREEIKGKYVKCNDCGKFGNAINSEGWSGQWEPTERCPHCGSEYPAMVIVNKE